jgi:cell division protein FtsQ
MTPSNRRVRDSTPPPSSLDAEPLEHPPLPAPAGASPPGRWMSAVRTTVGVVLVASSSVAVAWAARRHVMTSARFAIAEVEVQGCERRPSDAIAAESGLSVGANVFAADLDAARARLLADPWIAEATLARRLPGTILVQVAERKPAALVALGDMWLAGADGQPFKRLEPGDPIDVPVITGLRPEALADDREGATRSIRRAIDLGAEYERGGLARRMPLEEVHVEADGGFSLVVGKAGMELILGGPPFRRKLEQATRVVAELDGRGAKADAIMLDNDTRPERVVVRMR